MNQFAVTLEELTALIGQKEIDLLVVRRELRRAEETGASLLAKVQELEAQLAKPTKQNGKVPVDERA